ncbi:MAG: hypothetical protein LBU14_00625 [Candidatus Peribacteria bacterium]|jgi:hypothetical protein|nr:hypothetical protein [Candidatus Peribacteria bacterium]
MLKYLCILKFKNKKMAEINNQNEDLLILSDDDSDSSDNSLVEQNSNISS